jgi:peptidoglycan/LPS O-acetylase OafA/YrhL
VINQGRLRYLDALRGIAVLCVVLWHLYGTNAEYLPYGARFAVAPFNLMWTGVELFFLISGFVILMTLEHVRTLREFAVRRWLRLFPAMLIGSLLLLAFDLAFTHRTHRAPRRN